MSGQSKRWSAIRIAGIYLVAGVAWIALSDRLVSWGIRDPDTLLRAQTVKGIVFVILSTILVFAVARREFRLRQQAEADRDRMRERMTSMERLQAVGRLAGGVAHDFNNLLTAITGHTELLLEEAGDGKARRELEAIRASAERAAGLTRQLLAFGRRQVRQVEELDLASLVSDMEPLIRQLVSERIRIELALDGDAGTVRVDRTQMEQVVMNLAVNARDAIAETGTIRIGVARRTVGPEEAGARPYAMEGGEYVVLSVTDDGSGMDDEVQPRIFEPFFTTKPRGEGTGLGLSTVYGIVKQSDGYVTVTSAPGLGATFEVELPRAG